MSEGHSTIAPPARIIRPEPDPWRYGWRYVSTPQPDGTVRMEQVPLTEEDVLHPQEGDFIVETPVHDQDCIDLKGILQLKLAGRLGFVVLHNCRVDWGVPGLGAHGPDIAVLENVGDWDRTRGTFRVAAQGAKPALVIEVTSPSTRNVDIDEKVVEYFRAGVPFYAIVDRRVTEERPELRLLGYEATPQGYVRTNLNEQGRLWLSPVGLWLGVVGGELAIYDELGRRQGSFVEVAMRLETVAERARVEAQRADAEAQRAAAQAQRAEAAEARIRELEARLQSSGS